MAVRANPVCCLGARLEFNEIAFAIKHQTQSRPSLRFLRHASHYWGSPALSDQLYAVRGLGGLR